GTALQKWAARLPGTRSAVFESLGGEPWLKFDADPAALALHKVDPALARSTADLVISGGQVGELSWEDKPFQARQPIRITPVQPHPGPRRPVPAARQAALPVSGHPRYGHEARRHGSAPRGDGALGDWPAGPAGPARAPVVHDDARGYPDRGWRVGRLRLRRPES